MKRSDYVKRVQGPGKFEGEDPYVPYYWDMFLDGFADDDDGTVLTFDVRAEDKALFPELKRRKRVKILERSNGFVVEIR